MLSAWLKKRVVQWLLSQSVGRFVDGLSEQTLDVSLKRVVAENLTIRTDALDDVDTPFRVLGGSISTLCVVWKTEYNLELVLQGISVEVTLKDAPKWNADRDIRRKQLDKLHRLQQWEDNVLKQHDDSDDTMKGKDKEKEKRSLLQRTKQSILDNLELSLRDIAIIFRHPSSGQCAGLNIGSVTIRNEHSQDIGATVSKSLRIDGVALIASNRPVTMIEMRASGADLPFVVQPVAADGTLVYHRPGKLSSDTLQVRGKATIPELAIMSSREQYFSIANLVEVLDEWVRQSHRAKAYRPTTEVSENVRAWWVYAIQTTLDQLKDRKRRLSAEFFARRSTLRRKYIKRFTILLSKGSLQSADRTKLDAYEEELEYDEIILFRVLTIQQLRLKNAKSKHGIFSSKSKKGSSNPILDASSLSEGDLAELIKSAEANDIALHQHGQSTQLITGSWTKQFSVVVQRFSFKLTAPYRSGNQEILFAHATQLHGAIFYGEKKQLYGAGVKDFVVMTGKDGAVLFRRTSRAIPTGAHASGSLQLEQTFPHGEMLFDTQVIVDSSCTPEEIGIKIQCQPIAAFWRPSSISRILDMFESDDAQTVQSLFSSQSAIGPEALQKIALGRLSDARKFVKRIHFQVHAAAPTIVLPDPALRKPGKCGAAILVTLGQLMIDTCDTPNTESQAGSVLMSLVGNAADASVSASDNSSASSWHGTNVVLGQYCVSMVGLSAQILCDVSHGQSDVIERCTSPATFILRETTVNAEVFTLVRPPNVRFRRPGELLTAVHSTIKDITCSATPTMLARALHLIPRLALRRSLSKRHATADISSSSGISGWLLYRKSSSATWVWRYGVVRHGKLMLHGIKPTRSRASPIEQAFDLADYRISYVDEGMPHQVIQLLPLHKFIVSSKEGRIYTGQHCGQWLLVMHDEQMVGSLADIKVSDSSLNTRGEPGTQLTTEEKLLRDALTELAHRPLRASIRTCVSLDFVGVELLADNSTEFGCNLEGSGFASSSDSEGDDGNDNGKDSVLATKFNELSVSSQPTISQAKNTSFPVLSCTLRNAKAELWSMWNGTWGTVFECAKQSLVQQIAGLQSLNLLQAPVSLAHESAAVHHGIHVPAYYIMASGQAHDGIAASQLDVKLSGIAVCISLKIVQQCAELQDALAQCWLQGSQLSRRGSSMLVDLPSVSQTFVDGIECSLDFHDAPQQNLVTNESQSNPQHTAAVSWQGMQVTLMFSAKEEECKPQPLSCFRLGACKYESIQHQDGRQQSNATLSDASLEDCTPAAVVYRSIFKASSPNTDVAAMSISTKSWDKQCIHQHKSPPVATVDLSQLQYTFLWRTIDDHLAFFEKVGKAFSLSSTRPASAPIQGEELDAREVGPHPGVWIANVHIKHPKIVMPRNSLCLSKFVGDLGYIELEISQPLDEGANSAWTSSKQNIPIPAKPFEIAAKVKDASLKVYSDQVEETGHTACQMHDENHTTAFSGESLLSPVPGNVRSAAGIKELQQSQACDGVDLFGNELETVFENFNFLVMLYPASRSAGKAAAPEGLTLEFQLSDLHGRLHNQAFELLNAVFSENMLEYGLHSGPQRPKLESDGLDSTKVKEHLNEAKESDHPDVQMHVILRMKSADVEFVDSKHGAQAIHHKLEAEGLLFEIRTMTSGILWQDSLPDILYTGELSLRSLNMYSRFVPLNSACADSSIVNEPGASSQHDNTMKLTEWRKVLSLRSTESGDDSAECCDFNALGFETSSCAARLYMLKSAGMHFGMWLDVGNLDCTCDPVPLVGFVNFFMEGIAVADIDPPQTLLEEEKHIVAYDRAFPGGMLLDIVLDKGCMHVVPTRLQSSESFTLQTSMRFEMSGSETSWCYISSLENCMVVSSLFQLDTFSATHSNRQLVSPVKLSLLVDFRENFESTIGLLKGSLSLRDIIILGVVADLIESEMEYLQNGEPQQPQGSQQSATGSARLTQSGASPGTRLEGLEENSVQTQAIEVLSAPKQGSCQVEGVDIALVNDYRGRWIPVARLIMPVLHIQRKGHQSLTRISSFITCTLDWYNASRGRWDPLIRTFTVDVAAFLPSANALIEPTTSISVTSMKLLDVVITSELLNVATQVANDFSSFVSAATSAREQTTGSDRRKSTARTASTAVPQLPLDFFPYVVKNMLPEDIIMEFPVGKKTLKANSVTNLMHGDVRNSTSFDYISRASDRANVSFELCGNAYDVPAFCIDIESEISTVLPNCSVIHVSVKFELGTKVVTISSTARIVNKLGVPMQIRVDGHDGMGARFTSELLDDGDSVALPVGWDTFGTLRWRPVVRHPGMSADSSESCYEWSTPSQSLDLQSVSSCRFEEVLPVAPALDLLMGVAVPWHANMKGVFRASFGTPALGRLVVFDIGIAFVCTVPGSAQKLWIPFDSVCLIERSTTAAMIPNAVKITTSNGNLYKFRSLSQRGTTYRLICTCAMRSNPRIEFDGNTDKVVTQLDLADGEEVLGSFSCDLHTKIPRPGNLYVTTERVICAAGKKVKSIKWLDVESISKAKTAKIFPNAISFKSKSGSKEDNVFVSGVKWNREEVFEKVNNAWTSAQHRQHAVDRATALSMGSGGSVSEVGTSEVDSDDDEFSDLDSVSDASSECSDADFATADSLEGSTADDARLKLKKPWLYRRPTLRCVPASHLSSTETDFCSCVLVRNSSRRIMYQPRVANEACDIVFCPTISIQSALASPIHAIFWSGKNASKVWEGILEPGQSIPLLNADLRQQLYMQASTPGVSMAGSKKEIYLLGKQQPRRDAASITTRDGATLLIACDVERRDGGFLLTLYVPYWLVNATGSNMSFRSMWSLGRAGPEQFLAPDDPPRDFAFPTSDLAINKVSVSPEQGVWTSAFSLEAGVDGPFTVAASSEGASSSGPLSQGSQKQMLSVSAERALGMYWRTLVVTISTPLMCINSNADDVLHIVQVDHVRSIAVGPIVTVPGGRQAALPVHGDPNKCRIVAGLAQPDTANVVWSPSIAVGKPDQVAVMASSEGAGPLHMSKAKSSKNMRFSTAEGVVCRMSGESEENDSMNSPNATQDDSSDCAARSVMIIDTREVSGTEALSVRFSPLEGSVAPHVVSNTTQFVVQMITDSVVDIAPGTEAAVIWPQPTKQRKVRLKIESSKFVGKDFSFEDMGKHFPPFDSIGDVQFCVYSFLYGRTRVLKVYSQNSKQEESAVSARRSSFVSGLSRRDTGGGLIRSSKSKIEFSLSIAGISAVVLLRKPMEGIEEIMQLHIRQLHAALVTQFKSGRAETTDIEASIDLLQLDNQVSGTPFPVLLYIGNTDQDDTGKSIKLKASIKRSHPGVLLFPTLAVHVKPAWLYLDDALLGYVLQISRLLTLNAEQTNSKPSDNLPSVSAMLQNAAHSRTASQQDLKEYDASQSLMYVHSFALGDIPLRFWFNVRRRKDQHGHLDALKRAGLLGRLLRGVEMRNVRMAVDALQLSHLLGPPSQIGSRLASHVERSLRRALWGLAGAWLKGVVRKLVKDRVRRARNRGPEPQPFERIREPMAWSEHAAVHRERRPSEDVTLRNSVSSASG